MKNYSLELPLILAGYGKIEQLIRMIYCRGLEPKFLFEPQIIQFKKKIITSYEKCFPSFMDLTISNPKNNAVSWKIDCSVLEKSKAFQINPSEGRLDGGQSSVLKASFNPTEPGEYFQKAPLYLNNEYLKPYVEIFIKGYGSSPKLCFDKREV